MFPVKKMLVSAVVAGSIFGGASQAYAADMFGYVRTAVGSTSQDGDLVCFGLPGAGAKYRLGNECETYGELGFKHSFEPTADGIEFGYLVNMAYFRPTSTGFDNIGDNWYLAESYVTAKNVPMFNGATVWGGKRAYKRHDSFLNDLRYLGSEGDGAGIEGLPMMGAKFNYGYFRNAPNAGSWSTELADTRHDFRLTDIKLSDELTLELDAVIGRADSRVDTHTEDGLMLMAEITKSGVLGGYNRTTIQYLKGSLSRGAKGAQVPDSTLGDDSTRTRLMNELQWNSPQFNGMAAFVYQEDEGSDAGKWLSFGVRPVWSINNYFKFQVEYGYDQFAPESGDTRSMHKLTLAPTLVAGDGFWARPEIRLFATYAKWNDAANDAGVAGGVFGDDTSGYTVGVQTEVWF